MSDIETVKDAVRESIAQTLLKYQHQAEIQPPAIVLFTGVNGAGKTTSIAKIANILKNRGDTVLLAAADTFRAAASEQLEVWAKRLNVPVVKSAQGQDPAGIVYDALDSAKARGADVILCDTAGRLQNKTNLMKELEKIYKVCAKFSGSFNIYTLIVLDAGLGKNSLSQLEGFLSAVKADGVVLTKTDGSAKGGVVIAMADKYDIPIWFVARRRP
jgi:fused signal recognition particle receptor